MSSNLPLIRRSCRVLPFLLNFPCMPEGGGGGGGGGEGRKLEIIYLSYWDVQ